MFFEFADGNVRAGEVRNGTKLVACQSFVRYENNCMAGCHGNCKNRDQYLLGHASSNLLHPVSRSEFIRAARKGK